MASDLVSAAALIGERGGALGRPLHLMAATTSTNDEAKHAARAGAPHGSTWVAESQTAGRGRQGRAWLSPHGENLLVSVVWRQPCEPRRLPLLSIAAGLAVCEVARNVAPGADIRLKWPNDVVEVCRLPFRPGGSRGEDASVEDGGRAAETRGERVFKKLAGILVETSMTGGQVDAVVIGVGLNVLTRNFPEEVAPRATSLSLLSDHPVERAHVLAALLEALDRETTLVAARGLGLVRARLAAWDALGGETVRSELGFGVARGIDDEGRLVVEGGDGVRMAWAAGEVHLAREP